MSEVQPAASKLSSIVQLVLLSSVFIMLLLTQCKICFAKFTKSHYHEPNANVRSNGTRKAAFTFVDNGLGSMRMLCRRCRACFLKRAQTEQFNSLFNRRIHVLCVCPHHLHAHVLLTCKLTSSRDLSPALSSRKWEDDIFQHGSFYPSV